MANILKYNPIMDTDSYKFSHFLFYPEDTETVYSYAESRGGRYDEILFAGLQGYAKQLAHTRITKEHIEEAADFAPEHGVPFNREGWEIIVNEHDGFLPLRIDAVKEGTLMPYRNALCVLYNTDKRLPFLTSYVETPLLRDVWYQTTVATRVFNMKRKIRLAFIKSSDDPETAMAFSLLDFSSRGVTSYETSQKGGLAFLFSFIGTDNVPAVRYANKIYNHRMAGFSVAATEHSVMTSYGEENELDSFRQIIRKAAAKGAKIVSVVSDTWNIYRACQFWAQLAPELKELGLTLVVRPDSGAPTEVLPQVFQTLEAGFGFTVNSKGYKVLNGVKVLWGDGIDENSCAVLYDLVISLGYAADNLMLGSGGGLMQVDINRDTCKFAFKAAAVNRAGQWFGIAKDPITDKGKRSKAGAMQLQQNEDDTFYTNFTGIGPFTQAEFDEMQTNSLLEKVYENGVLYRNQNLDDIRALVNSQL